MSDPLIYTSNSGAEYVVPDDDPDLVEIAETAEGLADSDGIIATDDMMSLTQKTDRWKRMSVHRFLVSILGFERREEDGKKVGSIGAHATRENDGKGIPRRQTVKKEHKPSGDQHYALVPYYH